MAEQTAPEGLKVRLSVTLEYDLEPGPFAIERAVRDAMEAADWFDSLRLTTVLGLNMRLLPAGFLSIREDGADRYTVGYNTDSGQVTRIHNYGRPFTAAYPED